MSRPKPEWYPDREELNDDGSPRVISTNTIRYLLITMLGLSEEDSGFDPMEIEPGTNLHELLGLDSLDYIRISVGLKQTGIPLPEGEETQRSRFGTLQELTDRLNELHPDFGKK